jgi:hypothetical protein
MRIVPKRLTALVVTRPAKSNVMPKARTIGHAVGAGNLIVPAFGDSAG